MLRFCSLAAMGFLFVMISPKLRTDILGYLDSGINGMTANAPYSYIGAVVVVLGVFLFSISRGAQPQ